MIDTIQTDLKKRIITNHKIFVLDSKERAKLLPEQELYCNLFQGCQCAHVGHWNLNQDIVILQKFVELDGVRTWICFNDLLKNRSIDSIRRRIQRIDAYLKQFYKDTPMNEYERAAAYLKRIKVIVDEKKGNCLNQLGIIQKQITSYIGIVQNLSNYYKKLQDDADISEKQIKLIGDLCADTKDFQLQLEDLHKQVQIPNPFTITYENRDGPLRKPRTHKKKIEQSESQFSDQSSEMANMEHAKKQYNPPAQLQRFKCQQYPLRNTRQINLNQYIPPILKPVQIQSQLVGSNCIKQLNFQLTIPSEKFINKANESYSQQSMESEDAKPIRKIKQKKIQKMENPYKLKGQLKKKTIQNRYIEECQDHQPKQFTIDIKQNKTDRSLRFPDQQVHHKQHTILEFVGQNIDNKKSINPQNNNPSSNSSEIAKQKIIEMLKIKKIISQRYQKNISSKISNNQQRMEVEESEIAKNDKREGKDEQISTRFESYIEERSHPPSFMKKSQDLPTQIPKQISCEHGYFGMIPSFLNFKNTGAKGRNI